MVLYLADAGQAEEEASQTDSNHHKAWTMAMAEQLRKRVDDCRVNRIDDGEL